MTTRLSLLAALLLVPLRAIAADVPVTYTVEEKSLKAAVAGTPLAFELYSDNTCTTLAQSVPVNVEDVTIISKLKQMTPKNDTKLPNSVELRTTLASVSTLGNLYLKVAGSGVVPVGGECQAQAAQSADPDLPVESVTIFFGVTHPRAWGVLNPESVSLVDPSTWWSPIHAQLRHCLG